MKTRPSTPQIIRDICDELVREIMPLLPDTTAQVRLHMITAVLQSCATRAGNEIEWMRQETADYTAYAVRVADVTGDSQVRASVEAITPSDALDLDAVASEYSRAGEALAVALERAMDDGRADLVAQGEALLASRLERERVIAGGTASAGR